MQIQWEWIFVLLATLLAVGSGELFPAQLPNPPDRPPSPVHDGTTFYEESLNYRLQPNIKPYHYDIVIKPEYPKESTSLLGIERFKGTVTIMAKVEDDTPRIELHVQEIKDENIAIKIGEKLVTSTKTDDKYKAIMIKKTQITQVEKLVIERTDGNYFKRDSLLEIEIDYSADFKRRAQGFYVVEYGTEDNKADLLATQFQPTFARQAFPCFDEPAMKATFKLSIAVKKGIRAISNMPIDENTSNDDMINFKVTKRPMSTYLLAFIVYESKSYIATSQTMGTSVTEFKTWGRKDLIDGKQGTLSQKFGPQMLDLLSEYTMIPYNANEAFTKMDQAAIAGKLDNMENWGLAMYGVSVLLLDEESATEAEKKIVLRGIAHEMAHQWFGNLVTMEWWDFLWMNEGLANFFEYLVMHNVLKDWRMDEQYVVDVHMRIFTDDAREDAWPLTMPVNTPEEIREHFGSITDMKGGSILRYIECVLGEVAFEKAIQQYLKKREYKAALPEDLFTAFLEQNDKAITNLDSNELMEVLIAWTETEGYPLLTVHQVNATSYHINQSRFLLQENDTLNKEYPVQLTWKTNKETREVPLWLKKEDVIEIGEHDWVIFNYDQQGYYRVNYPDAMWRKLSDELEKKEVREAIVPMDRAALVDNALNLARAGVLPYEVAFYALRFLHHDTDFVPWAAARNALSFVARMMGREDSYKNFLRSLLKNVYNEVGFDRQKEDGHVELSHRVNVLNLACAVGHSNTPEKAKQELDKFLDDDSARAATKDPNTQPLIYCYGLKLDKGETWNKMYKAYKDEEDETKRKFYITSLGCINEEQVLLKFLSKSLDKNEVKTSEAASVFSAVTENPDGVRVALKFLVEKGYDKLSDAYGESVERVLSGLATRLTSKEELDKFTSAIQGHESAFNASLAVAEENVKWMEDNKSVVEEALKKAIISGTGSAEESHHKRYRSAEESHHKRYRSAEESHHRNASAALAASLLTLLLATHIFKFLFHSVRYLT